MTNEERLIEAVARAYYGTSGGSLWRKNAADVIAAMRAEGITMTPPPVPEPTYTLTFTTPLFDTLRALVETSKHRTPEEGELLDQLAILLADATPDEDTEGGAHGALPLLRTPISEMYSRFAAARATESTA